MTDANAQARAALEAAHPGLVELSHRIYENPELGYEEVQAAAWLTDALETAGFGVQRGFADMPTAFVATTGSGPLHIVICAEYDALPEIGHACGHNLIATAGIGAAAALKAALDPAEARVVILGTPAEEGHGGKVPMVRQGCFDDIDVAMMAHPSPADILDAPAFGVAHVDVEYRGKSVHASVFPERGINALDALVTAYQAIAQLRQHIRRDARLHGIITHGGDAPNIVPGYAKGAFYVRALKPWYLEELKKRVQGCFEAGALATGCEVHVDWHEDAEYAPIKHNRPLAEAYRRNGEAMGVVFLEMKDMSTGSTDMGNVSQVVPSIHPNFGVGQPVFTHSPEFAAVAATDAAHEAMLRTAQVLAMTGVDVALEPGLIERIKADFGSRG